MDKSKEMLTPQELGMPEKFQQFRTEIDQAGVIFQLASSSSPVSVLCAPPGAGKSAIYIAVSRLIPLLSDNPNFRTLVLVKTKALEDQLLSEFSSIGMVGIRGHSNYSCADLSFGEDEELLDMQCSGRRGGICFYNEKVLQCLGSNLIVTNNAHWFHIENCNDGFRLGRFDIIIIDEAHKVHNTLVDFVSIKLDESLFFRFLGMKLPKEFNYLPWSEFVDEATSQIQDAISNGEFLTRKQQIIIEKLEKAVTRVEHEVISNMDEWRMIRGDKGLTLSPVWGRGYAGRFLFRGIPQSIFCSATINKQTPELFGIKESEYIEVGSSFEKQRRPFYYLPVCTIDHKITDYNIRKVVEQIEELILTRTIEDLGWKGIIHSISYKWSEIIFRNLRPAFRDLVYIHDKYNAKEKIDSFKSDKDPCVLISPIVQEGHDFADDLARWQVIWKVPFLDGREPLVEARAKEDKTYKNALVIEALEQMYGRLVRNNGDFGETYIFDKHWQHFRNNFGFHKWFRLAWRQVDRIPEPLKF